ncbi:MAG: NADPH:quinone reductase [Candidatus Eremiobacteraeota bacterium]|nr:NADPH:quinone reductase [Candidatus Eremiobacteraeota bacterium]
MKAIRVDRLGGPEVLQLGDVPVPEPGPGEVLVRQTTIGINFIDTYLRGGLYPATLPFVLGREGAGTVEAVGPGVSEPRVGERVAYAQSALGAYAEAHVVPAKECVVIPAGIDDRTACAAMLQGITAHYLAHDTYPLKSGDVALIHAAAGGVGALLVQFAKRAGATVIATAGGPDKVQLAKEAGADHTIDYKAVDFAAAVRELVGEHGVDVAYDAVGKDTWERSMNTLRPRGYLVVYGNSSGPVPPIDPLKLMSAGSLYVTRPTIGHYLRTREELLGRVNDIFGAVAAGRLKVRVGEAYPLADAAQAHRDLEARKTVGKLLLIP